MLRIFLDDRVIYVGGSLTADSIHASDAIVVDDCSRECYRGHAMLRTRVVVKSRELSINADGRYDVDIITERAGA